MSVDGVVNENYNEGPALIVSMKLLNSQRSLKIRLRTSSLLGKLLPLEHKTKHAW